MVIFFMTLSTQQPAMPPLAVLFPALGVAALISFLEAFRDNHSIALCMPTSSNLPP